MKKTSEEKGFTLIELLVVISIIGLLSSIVLASISTARVKGRDSKRLQDLVQLRNALELYRLDKGAYPATNESDTNQSHSIDQKWIDGTGLLAMSLKPYLSHLPIDPKNNDVAGYLAGSHFYWYYRLGDSYALCGSYELPKSSTNFNPLLNIAGLDYHGDATHMFNEKNGGFCLIGK